jgi:heavy metal translocating P-type ATPase
LTVETMNAVAIERLSTAAREQPTAVDCVHCGLPLGRHWVVGTVEGEPSRFCCYGCVLAWQVTRATGEHGAASAILVRLGLAIFFALNVMMVSMPTYVPYVYGTAAGSSDGPLFQVLRVLAMLMTAPVLALLGWPILRGALGALRQGGANTDALIVLGTTAAYALSVSNTLAGRGAVYFDTAAMLLVLVTIGRYLEARAKAEAGAAVHAMLAPTPAVATRIRAGVSAAVAVDALRAGDVVRVTPGEAFPTDGVVIDGAGGVDESALTGESRTILKETGGAVASGTCSVDGLFRVRVTARAAESAAARVAVLMVAARRERAPAERVADRVAAVLVPIVIAMAAGSTLFWSMRAGIETGVLVGLAVLVVACPCGLGIATPVAVWTGLMTAARRGVIVRSAPTLERAADVARVFFDKTGTLTQRVPRLVAIEPASDVALSRSDLLARAAALEGALTHPLALAITEAARAAHCPLLEAGSVQVVAGRGVLGVVNGEQLAVGSVRFAREELGRLDDPHDATVWLWRGRQLLGRFLFEEDVRAEAAAAVAALGSLGVEVGLLSGDVRADAVVPRLIAPARATLGLLPEDKLAHIRSAAPQGATAMVGDGINDAPALAAADIGIAIGSATDLTRMTADVAIVSDDLRRVPWLLGYARRVRRVVRQNLFWAFAYNAAALAVAVTGALNPLVASLAMLGSSFVVVANARRLRNGNVS